MPERESRDPTEEESIAWDKRDAEKEELRQAKEELRQAKEYLDSLTVNDWDSIENSPEFQQMRAIASDHENPESTEALFYGRNIREWFFRNVVEKDDGYNSLAKDEKDEVFKTFTDIPEGVFNDKEIRAYREDWEVTSKFSKVADFVKGLVASAEIVPRTLFRGAQMVADITGHEEAAEWWKQGFKEMTSTKAIKKRGLLPEQNNSANYWAHVLGSAAGSALMTYGTSAGVAPASILFGVNAGTEHYAQARAKGMAKGKAFGMFLLAGGAEAGLEYGLSSIVLKGVGGPVRRMLRGMVTEAGQELSQQAAGNLVRSIYDPEKRTFSAYHEGFLEAVVAGAVIGNIAGLSIDASIHGQAKQVVEMLGVDLDTTTGKKFFKTVKENIYQIVEEEAPKIKEQTDKALDSQSNLDAAAQGVDELLSPVETVALEDVTERPPMAEGAETVALKDVTAEQTPEMKKLVREQAQRDIEALAIEHGLTDADKVIEMLSTEGEERTEKMRDLEQRLTQPERMKRIDQLHKIDTTRGLTQEQSSELAEIKGVWGKVMHKAKAEADKEPPKTKIYRPTHKAKQAADKAPPTDKAALVIDDVLLKTGEESIRKNLPQAPQVTDPRELTHADPEAGEMRYQEAQDRANRPGREGYEERDEASRDESLDEETGKRQQGLFDDEGGVALNPTVAATEAGRGVYRAVRGVATFVNRHLDPVSYTSKDVQLAIEKMVGTGNVGIERANSYGKIIRDFVGKDNTLDRALMLYLQVADNPQVVDWALSIKEVPGQAQKFHPLPDYVVDAIDRMRNLSPAEKEFADSIKLHYEAMGKMAQRVGVIEKLRERYSPGFWKQLGEWAKMKSWTAGKLEQNTMHAKRKVYDNYLIGIVYGKKPLTMLASQHVVKYDVNIYKAISSRIFVDTLKNMTMEDGRPALALRQNEDTSDYKRIDHDSFTIEIPNGKTDEDGAPETIKVDLAAHPKLQPILKNILEPSVFDKVQLLRVIKKTNLLMKRGKVRLGVFHWNALARQSMSFGVNPTKYKKGLDLILSQDKEIEGLVRYGMTLSSGEFIDGTDDFRGSIGDTTMEVVKGLPEKSKQFGKEMIAKWDAKLWHEFFRGLKAYVGKIELQRNKNRYPNMSKKDLYRHTAMDMNKVFGGMNLAIMGRSKTMQDIIRLALFAPDWTESNWRGWLSALDPKKGKGMRMMMARGMIIFGAAHVVVNTLLSGHLPDENEKGHKWDTDIGLTNLAGQPIYWNLFGHTLEPLKALKRPGQWAKGKVSLFVRQAIEQYTGADWRDRPFAMIDDLMDGYLYSVGKPRTGMEKIGQAPARLIHFGRSFAPIPADAVFMWLTGNEELPGMIDDLIGERMSRGPKGGDFTSDLRGSNREARMVRDRAWRKAKDLLHPLGPFGRYKVRKDLAKVYVQAYETLYKAGFSNPDEIIKNFYMRESATAAHVLGNMTDFEMMFFLMREMKKE